MKPLVFLTVRSFLNGFRRALSSPRRLIGTLFFLSYYIWIFRPFFGPPGDIRGPGGGIPGAPKFDFPPLAALDAVVFACFCAMTFVLALGLFTYRGGFKPADVDVLFATPLNPKTVMLFRLIRDYLLTLIVPLLFVVFLYRPVASGWTMLFRNVPHPESTGQVFRAMTASWLMISLAWVALGYATSLYFGRPEPQYDRRRKIAYTLYGMVMLVLPLLIIWQAINTRGVNELIQLSQSPWLRSVFFLAAGATNISMAPLMGSWTPAILGGALLGGVIVSAIALALSQSGWLYEEAAMKSTDAARAKQLQARGDVYGMIAERARSGQVKAGQSSWVHRLRFQGPKALLWKEILLQIRTSRAVLLLLPIVSTAVSVMVAFGLTQKPSPAWGNVVLAIEFFMVFLVTLIISQSGYVELLKRVDLLKPLPFKPQTTMFVEIVSRTTLAVALCAPGPIVLALFAPQLWQYSLAAAIMMPPTALLVSGFMVVIMLLFPDIDDPTQRGFRSMVSMLGLLITLGPSVGIFATLTLLRIAPFWASLPVAGLNLGLAVFAAFIAGNLYTSYNPSE